MIGPKLADGHTLKHGQEKVPDPEEESTSHEHLDSNDVPILDCDSKQEEPDGEFEKAVGQNVQKFAEEPDQKRSPCIFVCEVPSVSTSAIHGSDNLQDEIYRI